MFVNAGSSSLKIVCQFQYNNNNNSFVIYEYETDELPLSNWIKFDLQRAFDFEGNLFLQGTVDGVQVFNLHRRDATVYSRVTIYS